MGFWSGLGKILAGAGAGLVAPLTGGASLMSLPAILGASAGAIGSVASGASQGRAAGRAQEAGVNANQDLLKLQAARAMEDALMGRANLDLQRRQFALNAPGQRAANSVRGDVLANVRDANVAGPIVHTRGQVPQITGGLRPSLLGPNSRALGQNMSRQALLSQMQGDTFTPLPPPNIPSITPPPQAGKLDSILNWTGGIGTGLGMWGDLLQRRNPYRVSHAAPNPDEDWQDVGVG